jgi:hypothetical protein
VQPGELLFANRSYRLWFGGDARGHQQLGGAASGTEFEPESEEDVDGLSGLPAEGALHHEQLSPHRALGA